MLLVPLAAAGVTFAPGPDVDVSALDPLPIAATTAVGRDWYGKARARETIRGVVLTGATFEEPITTCLGSSPAATVTVRIAVDSTGVLDVQAPKDPLGACVAGAMDGHRVPMLVASTARQAYTVTWDGTPSLRSGTPTPEGFCPELDRAAGFSGVPWGAAGDSLPNAEVETVKDTSRTYRRSGDQEARWLGAKIAATFAFGESGFYAAGLTGQVSGAFQVRERLVELYGQPRWDGPNKAWYWRGNERILQMIPDTGNGFFVVSLLDIGRARAGGLVERLPGDPATEVGPEGGTRLPKIYGR